MSGMFIRAILAQDIEITRLRADLAQARAKVWESAAVCKGLVDAPGVQTVARLAAYYHGVDDCVAALRERAEREKQS